MYVILLNWRGESDTIACIQSLIATEYEPLTIVLVDNARDGSGERLRDRFPQMVFVPAPHNLGFAAGNNLGMDRAAGLGADYLLVLNNDTVVERDCVAALVDAAERTGAGAVGGKILYYDNPGRIWFAGGDFLPRRALGRHRRQGERDDGVNGAGPVTFLTGCCMLLRSSAYRATGGFDAAYFAYVEDVDLSLRLLRLGFTLWYEPAARLLHRIPMDEGSSTPFQIRQRDRNRRRLARTHYGPVERIAFGLWYYPTRAAHFARYVLAGKWPQAAAIVAGALGSLGESRAPSGEMRTRPAD